MMPSPSTITHKLHLHSATPTLEKPTVSSFSASVASISQVVLYLLDTLVSVSLFYLQHNLFILGFAVGFIFDQKAYSVIKKVSLIFNAKRTQRESILFFAGGALGAVLTMPTSLCLATLYRSAELGVKIYRSCKRARHQY